ncbi:hypothetical protein GCM10008967_03270 [Bacillus carboniphilus]|uniref:Lipoprotein n=1 Tax=Bacillus carboniphilus TaxID=86663 RepID=A0ABN0VS81_9BACI
MKRWMYTLIAIPFLLLACAQEDAPPENTEDNLSETEEHQDHLTETEQETEPPAVDELMSQYSDLAYAKGTFKADDNLRVEQFSSKEELIEESSQFLSEEFAREVVDLRFEEKGDGVYVKAMDGPVTLDEEQDYNLEKLSESEYRATQQHSSELHGEFELVITFVRKDDRWVIDGINQT